MIVLCGRVMVFILAYMLILIGPFGFYLGVLLLLMLGIHLALMLLQESDSRLGTGYGRNKRL